MSKEIQLSREQWREIQRRLASLNLYTGQIDGLRGPLTDDGIVAFKRSIGFLARPLMGELTYAALMAAAARARPASDPIPWLDEARKVMGLHEKRDTGRLKSWFHKSVDWIDPREISWCGAFVATCYLKWRPDQGVPQNVLGARQWGNFGERCEPQRGAVLTFWRISKSSWQGHVGFMVGQDKDYYHILGGNQSDAVTIAKLAKSRFLESRWPTGYPQPLDYAWGTIQASISKNEA